MDVRRRRAARLALYTSLLLTGGMAYGLVQLLSRPMQARSAEQWIHRDYPNLTEVKLLQQYVQVDTSDTTGDEIAGARFLADQLEAVGIATRIEVVGEKRANLYAMLEGEDKRPLVLHNHIDVKAADPTQWFYPPYEGRIDLPWIYGRGVFDMKSVAIAQLMAMIDLKKSGQPLKRSVLFLATSSEENGSRLGVRRIQQLHPELVRSFWAVLTEGGIVEARTREDIKYWGVEVVQKRFADVVICGGDRERLVQLRQDLIDRGHTETNVKLIPEARMLFERYAPTRDRQELRDLLGRPEQVLGDIAAFRKLPNYLRSMFRNEAVPFGVEADPSGGYRLLVKIHLLPQEELAPVLAELVPPWLTRGLSVQVDEPPAAHGGSPTSLPVFQEVVRAIEERYPGTPAGPYFLPWSATDSRFFRAAGVPSYGFSPFLIMNTDTLQVDAPNERMALPGYVEGVELYRDVVRRLAL